MKLLKLWHRGVDTMENERSKNLLMIIQGKSMCFAEITSYDETEENFCAQVKVEAGVLKEGEEYTIIYQPFDIFKHSTGILPN